MRAALLVCGAVLGAVTAAAAAAVCVVCYAILQYDQLLGARRPAVV